MFGKYFYLFEYKYFNLNIEQWETNYQTFLFTASYVAIHNSTKDCTFLVPPLYCSEIILDVQ